MCVCIISQHFVLTDTLFTQFVSFRVCCAFFFCCISGGVMFCLLSHKNNLFATIIAFPFLARTHSYLVPFIRSFIHVNWSFVKHFLCVCSFFSPMLCMFPINYSSIGTLISVAKTYFIIEKICCVRGDTVHTKTVHHFICINIHIQPPRSTHAPCKVLCFLFLLALHKC